MNAIFFKLILINLCSMTSVHNIPTYRYLQSATGMLLHLLLLPSSWLALGTLEDSLPCR